MSISNLFQPNPYDLFSNSLTCNELQTGTMTTDQLNTTTVTATDVNTTNVNATTVTATDVNTTNVNTTTIETQSINITNDRDVAFQVYYIDTFGDFQALPGIGNLRIVRIGNFLTVDFPDIDVTLGTNENAIIIANPGITGAGPPALSMGEIVSHNYEYNFIMNVAGIKNQATINIPQGTDEPFTISLFSAGNFSGALDLFGMTFNLLVQ